MTAKKTWQVYGRCYNQAADKGFIEADIQLPEQESGLSMRDRENATSSENPGPFVPECFGMPIDSQLAVDLISNGLKKNETLLKALKDKSFDDESEKLISKLVNLNYGITFEKSLILKILSQPNCAGIRSYLCAREVGEPELHLSLVMVGVDINGFDLNYDLEAVKGDQIPNQSLLAEYGYPPGGQKSLLENKTTDKHYVLLNLARKLRETKP